MIDDLSLPNEYLNLSLDDACKLISGSDAIPYENIKSILNFYFNKFGIDAYILLKHIKCTNIGLRALDFLEIFHDIPIFGEIINSLKPKSNTFSFLANGHDGYLELCSIPHTNLKEVKKISGQLLTSSASSGNVEIAKLALELRAEPSNTHLLKASEFGHYGVVKALLENGADINCVGNYDRKTALHCAAENGRKEIVELLVEWKININVANLYGENALLSAAEKGFVDIVKFLHEQGSSLHEANSGGYTPLHYACMGGHEKTVEYLLDNGALIDAESRVYETPLLQAVQSVEYGIVKMLLQRGANPNIAEATERMTPLHIAVKYRQADMVGLLLSAGANPLARNVFDETALHIAVAASSVLMCRILMCHGIDSSSPNYLGKTAADAVTKYTDKWQELTQFFLEQAPIY